CYLDGLMHSSDGVHWLSPYARAFGTSSKLNGGFRIAEASTKFSITNQSIVEIKFVEESVDEELVRNFLIYEG
ncbi:MAG: hypothetical protein ACRC6E_04530, partial [Fusobacteriaceae bacterium]